MARSPRQSLYLPLGLVIIIFVAMACGRATRENSCDGQYECHQEGYFTSPTNCSRFYRCVDFEGTGTSFRLFPNECGPGTWFDDSISVCNHPWAQQPLPKCAECMHRTSA